MATPANDADLDRDVLAILADQDQRGAFVTAAKALGGRKFLQLWRQLDQASDSGSDRVDRREIR